MAAHLQITATVTSSIRDVHLRLTLTVSAIWCPARWLFFHCCSRAESNTSQWQTFKWSKISMLSNAQVAKKLVDEDATKIYPWHVGVGPWRSTESRGRLWRKKDWGWSPWASLSNMLVPRHGHCLRAKLNLNETPPTKGERCWRCSMAEPAAEGGGEVWQPNERMPCQKGAMIPHNKAWRLPCCQMLRAMRARWSHVERKVLCFREQTSSICWATGYISVLVCGFSWNSSCVVNKLPVSRSLPPSRRPTSLSRTSFTDTL